jgi:uncharacterized phage-associated protein
VTRDVRGIANFVLDSADRQSIGISNLGLNKIIYFLHSAFLHHFGKPLVSAKIEAWDYGPVFREVYHQFKRFGRSEITDRANKLNAFSGSYDRVSYEFDFETELFLNQQCSSLLRIPAGKLVDLSHMEDGAWHRARYQNGRVNPGVEITNELILTENPRGARH